VHLLAKEFSGFNEISVYETNQLYGELGKFRCIQFADDAVQGAMDMKNQKRIVLQYQRAIIHLMELNHSIFEKVFVIGHGIGTIASHYPNKHFTVAEIDEKVLELSKRYFKYRTNNVTIGDGRQILGSEQPNTYDYIILDAFTHKGTPMNLTSIEFFAMTMAKLKPHGKIIMNLMGKIKNDRLINAIHSTLRETYRHTNAYVLPVENEADSRNIIVMASNNRIDIQAERGMSELYEVELEQGHIIMDSN